MTEERFAEFLKSALDESDPVPAAPREEMWARIQGQRQIERQAVRTSHRTWISWGVGLAAMLAVGVGIGRFSATRSQTQRSQTPPQAQVQSASQSASPAQSQTAYRMVVAQYMASAEAMLTTYKTQPQGTLDPQVAEWARDLLMSTRLLMDSPAADDPKVAALLEDLELVIAQIARLSAPSKVEREIIQDGMNKTAVLPRLRATQPVSAGT